MEISLLTLREPEKIDGHLKLLATSHRTQNCPVILHLFAHRLSIMILVTFTFGLRKMPQKEVVNRVLRRRSPVLASALFSEIVTLKNKFWSLLSKLDLKEQV